MLGLSTGRVTAVVMVGALAGVAGSGVAGSGVAETVMAGPAVFGDRRYEAAKAEAAEAGKLLYVRATAEWCGPCKQMDRTTFVDPRVVAWLGEHAVAVSVDVDEQSDVAGDLGIRAMPTSIAFRGADELGRAVGYRGADELLTWLEGARTGRVAPPPAREDVRGRLQHARELYNTRKYDEATREFVWLWHNMLEHDESFYGVRLSFMASDMYDLGAAHAPARAEWVKLRDEAAVELEAGRGGWELLHDWLTLNDDILDEHRPIVEWVERVSARPGGMTAVRRYDHIVSGVLVDEGRWKLYGELIGSGAGEATKAVAEYRQRLGFAQQDERMRDDERYRSHLRDRLRTSAAQMHAALLAADRPDDAWAVVDRITQELDDAATRERFVEMAIRADVVTNRHERLVGGADEVRRLRERVAKVDD